MHLLFAVKITYCIIFSHLLAPWSSNFSPQESWLSMCISNRNPQGWSALKIKSPALCETWTILPRILNVLFLLSCLFSLVMSVFGVCPLQLKKVTGSSLYKRKLGVHEAPAPPSFQWTWLQVFKSLLTTSFVGEYSQSVLAATGNMHTSTWVAPLRWLVPTSLNSSCF